MVRSTLLGLAASLVLSTAMVAQEASNEKPKPGTVEYLDFLNGFRGVPFGTEFAKFSGLTVDQDRGKLKLYTKKDENMTLGLAKLATVVYHFFDGKFYGVTLHTEDVADTRTLLAIAATGFGTGTKLDPNNTIWQGNTAWAQFSQHPGTGEGNLFIGNCELARQLGQYEQQAASEAASQL